MKLPDTEDDYIENLELNMKQQKLLLLKLLIACLRYKINNPNSSNMALEVFTGGMNREGAYRYIFYPRILSPTFIADVYRRIFPNNEIYDKFIRNVSYSSWYIFRITMIAKDVDLGKYLGKYTLANKLLENIFQMVGNCTIPEIGIYLPTIDAKNNFNLLFKKEYDGVIKNSDGIKYDWYTYSCNINHLSLIPTKMLHVFVDEFVKHLQNL